MGWAQLRGRHRRCWLADEIGSGNADLDRGEYLHRATNVNAGTLILSGSGSIAASPTITVATGTLNVGGVTGGFILASGQTLRGGGR